MLRYCITLTIFITAACSQTQPQVQQRNAFTTDAVFEDVLYASIDSVTEENHLDGHVLAFHNLHPDNFRRISIDKVIHNEMFAEYELEMNLLKKLRPVVDDTVILKVPERAGKGYHFYHTDLDNKIDFDSDNFFGSISLSNAVFDTANLYGCYYIQVNCGNNCGSVASVFVDLVDDEWQIFAVNPLWGN